MPPDLVPILETAAIFALVFLLPPKIRDFLKERAPRPCSHGAAPAAATCQLCRPRLRFPWDLLIAGAFLVGLRIVGELLDPNFTSLAWLGFFIACLVYIGAIFGTWSARKTDLAKWKERIEPCKHGVEGARLQPERCPECSAAIEAARQEVEQAEAERQREFLRRANTLESLRSMEPMEFQNFMWFVFRRLGYEVIETPAGSDGGVDGFLSKSDEDFILQCKRYQGDVGEPVVRDLYGTMQHHEAEGAFLVTTGSISRKARTFCEGKRIELIDSRALAGLVEEAGLVEAFNPWSTPAPVNCPQCRRPLRIWRMRGEATETALVCAGFPGRCSYTRNA